MVALWEAFRREVVIATCMASAGYVYAPAAEYPFDDVVKIGSSLGVKIVRDPSAGPAKRNDDQRDLLSDEELDGYYRSLIGEPLATVQRVDAADGAGAPGGYATGGCTGKASGRVGSLWDTRRQLEPAWRALTDEVMEQREVLADVERRYRGVEQRIRADEAFLAYLEAAT